jgi:hypothetical protein
MPTLQFSLGRRAEPDWQKKRILREILPGLVTVVPVDQDESKAVYQTTAPVVANPLSHGSSAAYPEAVETFRGYRDVTDVMYSAAV